MKQEEFLEMYNSTIKNKKLTGVAKWFTLIVVGLVFLIGVFGSFQIASFNMSDYIIFLDSFKWFISPLIISVGAGKVAEKISVKKEEE